MAELFTESRYRWLHFSCHGDEDGLQLRLDDLPFGEFSRIFKGRLSKRRLFVSACEVGTKRLAKAIFKESPECYSVVAPTHRLGLLESAVIWGSFYHLMRRRRRDAMKSRDITAVLAKLGKLFRPEMRHYQPKDL